MKPSYWLSCNTNILLVSYTKHSIPVIVVFLFIVKECELQLILWINFAKLGTHFKYHSSLPLCRCDVIPRLLPLWRFSFKISGSLCALVLCYIYIHQTWALALYFQVRSLLSAHFLSMDPYRSNAHFADFQVRSSLNRSKKKPVVCSWKRAQ